MSARKNKEKLALFRLMMVFSSFSPLFVLWAIRGSKIIPDCYLIWISLFMVIVPSFLLWIRSQIAHNNGDSRQLIVGIASDSNDHILIYLFTMLMPLYSGDLGDIRNLLSIGVAFMLVGFIFFRLKLYYVNILFILLGYRVYTVLSPDDNNPYTGSESYILITQRTHLSQDETIVAYRITDSVYLEWSNK